jgi:hypothetical protein
MLHSTLNHKYTHKQSIHTAQFSLSVSFLNAAPHFPLTAQLLLSAPVADRTDSSGSEVVEIKLYQHMPLRQQPSEAAQMSAGRGRHVTGYNLLN